LTWTPPSNDGGSTITGYAIYRRVGTGPESLLTSRPGNETSYIDTAVTNSTMYTYRLAAMNAAGQGALSNAVSVTPVPPAVIIAPDPPRNLAAARARSGFAVVLTWTAPARDGGSPIASYFVYRRGPGESSFTLIDATNASTRTYTDSAVARRSSYSYVVTAFNTYFESGRSNEVTIRTK
jgi:titin